MSQLDLTKIQFPDVMDLRTAAIFLNLSEMRVRALVRGDNPELKATKDEETGKWQFRKADLEAWKNTPRKRAGGGPRSGGRSFVIAVAPDKLEAVKNALKPLGVELKPRYDYAKQKAYREKRAAEMSKGKTATPVQAAPAPKK